MWIQKRLEQSFPTTSSLEQFWESIDIVIKRPHIINRRLVGVDIVGEVAIANGNDVDRLRSRILCANNIENVEEIISSENLFSGHYENRQQSAVIQRLIPKTKCNHMLFEFIVKGKFLKMFLIILFKY